MVFKDIISFTLLSFSSEEEVFSEIQDRNIVNACLRGPCPHSVLFGNS